MQEIMWNASETTHAFSMLFASVRLRYSDWKLLSEAGHREGLWAHWVSLSVRLPRPFASTIANRPTPVPQTSIVFWTVEKFSSFFSLETLWVELFSLVWKADSLSVLQQFLVQIELVTSLWLLEDKTDPGVFSESSVSPGIFHFYMCKWVTNHEFGSQLSIVLFLLVLWLLGQSCIHRWVLRSVLVRISYRGSHQNVLSRHQWEWREGAGLWWTVPSEPGTDRRN